MLRPVTLPTPMTPARSVMGGMGALTGRFFGRSRNPRRGGGRVDVGGGPLWPPTMPDERNFPPTPQRAATRAPTFHPLFPRPYAEAVRGPFATFVPRRLSKNLTCVNLLTAFCLLLLSTLFVSCDSGTTKVSPTPPVSKSTLT